MRQRLLEVERKFCSNGPSAFFANSGPPPFRKLSFHGRQQIQDKYFDHGELLRNKGIYVRQRNESWEAKVKKGGDYINSQFEETTSESKIAEYAHKVAGVQGKIYAQNNFGLNVVAQLNTTRLSWTADEKFQIVLDTTDFGHEVGEVELQMLVTLKDGSKNDVNHRAEMDSEIVKFMKQYAWAFPPGKPKGKLTAYFEMQENFSREAANIPR